MIDGQKIVALESLAGHLQDLRADGRRIVHCHGVFDLLHVGHIRYFKQARAMGDVLVVTVTPDRYVNKGPNRPVFTESLRLEAIAALDCVDYVALNQWPKAVETIRLLRPHFYVKGSEFRDPKDDISGNIVAEKEAIEASGGIMAFTEDIVFSSSSLINNYLDVHGEDTRRFLRDFAARHGFAALQRALAGCRDLRVLFLGETIIDEYQYCQTLGKSGKEPILAAQFFSMEQFAGGVLAAANHAAEFCGDVRVLSALGEVDSHEAFIRGRLHAGVRPEFLRLPDRPTIVKRRFVERYPFQKLFEVYVMNDQPCTTLRQQLLARLEALLPAVDAVLVTDYGHGLIDEQTAEFLAAKAPYLAVNTQKNAGNHGFNTISKYPHADFVSVSEAELRLDWRRKTSPLPELMAGTAERLNCGAIIATQGDRGVHCYRRGEGVVHVPALSHGFRDRVGAGDAVFAVTGMCAHGDAPAAVLGLVANAVGAAAVDIIGNRGSVQRLGVEKHLMHLLK